MRLAELLAGASLCRAAPPALACLARRPRGPGARWPSRRRGPLLAISVPGFAPPRAAARRGAGCRRR
eukprot:2234061-Alexandrium_andersonii.AAC.1